jgi:phosphotransferase system enzyme I (PtsI)
MARACDFLSVGTKDLAQYLRGQSHDRRLADLLDLWQPAVLDLVRMTAAAGGLCSASRSVQ